ncbi:MAG TPA: DUF5985 family protein [Rhizomicrobium sp.]|jgi:hypothetical protein|nr:DUF5985 family protein [Rhizomicrobium sp.]
MTRTIAVFFAGADTLGFLVASLLFLRAWRRTHDSLFGSFAAAFVLLAINQALTVFITLPEPEKSWIYLLRLAAFILLIFAIIAKNMQARIGKP